MVIAQRHGTVIIADRNIEAAEVTAADIVKSGGIATAQALDISSVEAVRDFVNQTIKKNGRIDALVNSAGITGPTGVNLEEIDPKSFQQVIEINLFGAIWLTQALLPSMKAQKYGRMIHVASIAGKEGNPGMSPYNSAKAGMIGFVKGVAKEAAPFGVTINSIAPAVIRTPMNATTADETLKYMIARIPVGRVGEPEEVAETIAFAVSRACSFTTGFTFDASGGRATY